MGVSCCSGNGPDENRTHDLFHIFGARGHAKQYKALPSFLETVSPQLTFIVQPPSPRATFPCSFVVVVRAGFVSFPLFLPLVSRFPDRALPPRSSRKGHLYIAKHRPLK